MNQPTKVDILAIGVHPDDVELSCAGTLLRHIAQGKKVGLLDLTQGELGTRGTAEIRLQEAADSARMMGASFRINLGMRDGFFQPTEDNTRKIIEVIRAAQPKIVLANAPRDRHPDHGRASHLVYEACFYAGLQKIETADVQGQPQERWRPDALYYYVQDYNLPADFVVDISDYVEQREQLILAFRSQFHVPEADEYSQELQTPISGKDFLDYLRGRARTVGRPCGFEYGEGFISARTPGVKDLLALH